MSEIAERGKAFGKKEPPPNSNLELCALHKDTKSIIVNLLEVVKILEDVVEENLETREQ